tara:strand:- start:251 stop:1111 length:861 start_codon:yes stop_codon:yes gene_type:complete
MSGSKIPYEVLPVAPAQYDNRYVNRLANQLQNVITAINNPITNIPSIRSETDVSSLVIGDLYKDDYNFVRIVAEEEAGNKLTDELAEVAFTGAYSDLSGTPYLSSVATSGSYLDLSNTPAAALPLTGGTVSGNVSVTGDLDATNLTLSGGVYLGGTGSANLLDDYEEGTWTPIINVGSAVVLTGSYVKIGKLVTLQFKGNDFSSFTSTTNISITGLPFINGPELSVGTLMTRYFGGAASGGLITYMGPNSTEIALYQSATGTWNRLSFSEYTAIWDAYFTITYATV